MRNKKGNHAICLRGFPDSFIGNPRKRIACNISGESACRSRSSSLVLHRFGSIRGVFMWLDESSKEYQGGLVVVKPVYGWGWSRMDDPEIPVPAEINGVPRPFHCRIQDFFYFQGELRGAVGVVEESGHIYDGLWVIFYTRVIGDFNFGNNSPYCNIEIGADAPVGEWPEFTSDSWIVNGYCFVGVTLREIEESIARMGR